MRTLMTSLNKDGVKPEIELKNEKPIVVSERECPIMQ